MNKTTNFQIGEHLWVVTEPLQQVAIQSPATAVDHVFVIDCSGSMSADLPKLRTHIKSRISKILKLDDTFTLDDTTLTMDFAGTTVECAVELRETEVKC